VKITTSKNIEEKLTGAKKFIWEKYVIKQRACRGKEDMISCIRRQNNKEVELPKP
jgi:hypothetical protein